MGTGVGPNSGEMGGMTRAGMYQNSGGRGCSKPIAKSLYVVCCLSPLISEQVLQAGEGSVPRAGWDGPTCGARVLSFWSGAYSLLLQVRTVLLWWLVCRAGLNGLTRTVSCFVPTAAVTLLILCL